MINYIGNMVEQQTTQVL